MWSDISYMEILFWMTMIGSICWIIRSIIFAKKSKITPTETNLNKKRDAQLNVAASKTNPAKKATVRIGVPSKSSTRQTIRISLPPKPSPAPTAPYGTFVKPVVPTLSTGNEAKGKNSGITGPAPLPIAHPGILPIPIPVNPGIPQVVFRMRILKQLWEEQLASEDEYLWKKAEILRNL